eukprot:TRINITY_DN767_c0_g1_i1.p1 TRINITY_DN767_c0_g1~~TRINITY_DN767_c0_g1_i1.p1  ORF type:complete len:129 (-),score=27.90 TRINITY_DN767_c0_g1_i1:153-539(-)
METLALAALIRTQDTPKFMRSRSESGLRKISVSASPTELEPNLVKHFALEYSRYVYILRLFSGDQYREQRVALESVQPALEEVCKQLQFHSAGQEQITNGNLVWYIQKMTELRNTAMFWAKQRGLVQF